MRIRMHETAIAINPQKKDYEKAFDCRHQLIIFTRLWGHYENTAKLENSNSYK